MLATHATKPEKSPAYLRPSSLAPRRGVFQILFAQLRALWLFHTARPKLTANSGSA
jgi:hypothetical protein